MTNVFEDIQFNIFVVSVSVITFVIARFLKKKKKIKNYFIVLCVPIIMYGWKWYSLTSTRNDTQNTQINNIIMPNEISNKVSIESGDNSYDTYSSSMLSEPFSLRSSN